jgi:hypothetical protein
MEKTYTRTGLPLATGSDLGDQFFYLRVLF